MKRLILAGAGVAALVVPMAATFAATGTTGNGAPSGAHYNLNIIGVPKNKTASMTGTSGKTIFVPLYGSCKINLQDAGRYAFDVIDRNCTDGSALFQLPNPDPDNDGTTVYSVYARALGKPGGSSKTTTCFTEGGEEYCSVYTMTLVRSGGKQSFTNVSKELLYVYYCVDGQMTRDALFTDDATRDYYWQYDNNGLKLAQLRFYETPTTVDPINNDDCPA